jgi:molybdopterin synthase catalytic subunit
MTTEYRIIHTMTFESAEERDKAYEALKAAMTDTVSKAAVFKRADITRDEGFVPDTPTTTERVI